MDKAIEIEEYALIGDLDELNIKIKEGWVLINTFPNPYPQPYFFSLIGKIKQAESISELQAHKAKIESLKELCSEKSKILDDVVMKTKYQTLAVKAASNKAIYAEILQKLEELDK